MTRKTFAAIALISALMPSLSSAASISVAPTKLEPTGQHTTLTIKAEGAKSSVVQVRVMAWDENKPANVLKPTRDVVVSPPMSKLKPRQELTVRAVRVSKKPLRKRECYRVLVDRIPTDPPKGSQKLALRLRHSIPLCFNP
ncbi:fimbria/pilus periplasmic chaperone [Sulfitobacter sp. R18_1]|uniref:fimbrial biogenesis chaperone n=1 Tax=Sulfitobacter sp. R18_1 TaxID=2821104 RepID=UPI001ADA9FC2|nr:fimbria/pilus periplasmic chaperone [Sulfitobacter sp. R18_1]MBO9428696.1 molecular chaperone [Sulfitobacter sp. R18_1]